MGYLNKENETKEVMTSEHWLKLGDLGYHDEDGFVSVLGKEENFITLSTGEVISPLRVIFFSKLFQDEIKRSITFQIEQRIRLELPCIAQAMVVGDGQDYLAVLLTLQTKRHERTGKVSTEMTENAKRYFRLARLVHLFIGGGRRPGSA